MDWQGWIGREVFVRLKTGKVYSGKVYSVDDSSPIIFIEIIDKFGDRVTFVNSEILELKEEKLE